MYKYGMWKPDINNQTLPHGVPQMERHQITYNIQRNTKFLLGSDCEAENVMKFLKDIGVFVKI